MLKTTSKTVPIHDNVFDVLFDVVFGIIFYVILYHVFDNFFMLFFIWFLKSSFSIGIKQIFKSTACLLKLGGIPDFINFTYIWKQSTDFL